MAEKLVIHVEVVAVPDECVLLGRDVLNHFVTTLDGPELTFELALSADAIQ